MPHGIAITLKKKKSNRSILNLAPKKTRGIFDYESHVWINLH